jgi:hypothetical protein
MVASFKRPINPSINRNPVSRDNKSVRMKGIQNKIIVSQKAFIIDNYGLHHYKGKPSKFLFEYINLSVNWCDKYSDDIRPRSRYLKYIWCYRSHRVPYAGFQALKVADLNLVENFLHITPQGTKQQS